jgi:hypothetical protein
MEKRAAKEQTDEPASPDESGMAMDQAKFIGYVSKEIMDYLQGNNEFPEWMQNKLTGFHEKAKDMHAVMAGKYESVEESLRKDIAAMSAKFPEGSKVRMKHDGKVAKVVSVGKDFVKVAVGNKTMDHKPSELEKLNEANYQVKAGKHAIGSASYDDKEIVTVTPQQAKKLNSYFQKNKDGDMWKKLFQGGGRGGKGAENQKDFDSMVAGLKESTELDEAAYKVPNNYAAMKARMNKRKKVSNAQIHKVLGPTKNAQQGIEALKKAFKVNDKEAEALMQRVLDEANRGSDSYRVKYKGDINTVRADSPEDALKKTMKAFGISSFNKSDYMKNASAIAESVNFHVRMDHLKDQESKKVVAILQKAEKSGSIKYKGESDKGISFSAKSEPAVNTVTKDIAKVSRVADVEIMEKLEVSDGLDQWIKDFQASDAPQFADQSKEEIRNMAIAAYLAAKKRAKETKESTKAYGKSMDDIKKKNISSKDKKTLSKLADLMAKEKGKK